MRRFVIIACVILGAYGCQPGLEETTAFAPLDETFFHCKVQPLLTKSCSTYACHGAMAEPRRYFTVFARNRLRIDSDLEALNSELSEREKTYNYNSARAQVELEDVDKSLLLIKPLDEAGGGYFHRGAEIFKLGDVYLTRDDLEYQVIEDWIRGEGSTAGCTDAGGAP